MEKPRPRGQTRLDLDVEAHAQRLAYEASLKVGRRVTKAEIASKAARLGLPLLRAEDFRTDTPPRAA